MKGKFSFSCIVLGILSFVLQAGAQGTAFTYQGRLEDGTNPANGIYDFRCGLYATNTGGTAVDGLLTNSAVPVSNGLFAITLDFGNIFEGTTYWLEIGVRTNGASAFTPLSPRQQLTPAPYAIFAEGANATNLSGTIPAGSLSGTYTGVVNFSNVANSFTGNGAGLANVNAAALGGLVSSNFWQLGGNTAAAGSQIIGTLNSQPLDLYADGVRGLRLVLRSDAGGVYSNAPNVIGGSAVNAVKVGVVGATVSGGGGQDTNGVSHPNQVNANFGTISGGFSNSVSSLGVYGFIGGGQGNVVNQGYGTIGGGLQNIVSNAFTTIGGGFQNSVGGPGATVGGGGLNLSSFLYCTVAGGLNNSATGTNAGYSTVGGGQLNSATGDYSTVGGGYGNAAAGAGAFIGGGGYDGTSFQPNNIQGIAGTIGGGVFNNIEPGAGYAFIGGGNDNFVTGGNALVCGGFGNAAAGFQSVMVGGQDNAANGNNSALVGGVFNLVSGQYGVLVGGVLNSVTGSGSFVGGGGYDGTVFAANNVAANAATLGGGLGNTIPSGSRYAFIGGGASNTASAYYATVAGGVNNRASGEGAVVSGGGTDGFDTFGNQASGSAGVVGGGNGNSASGADSTVGGGEDNAANAFGSTVPGGAGNVANGYESLACGSFAHANHDYSFVWADDEAGAFSSTRTSQFAIQAAGGVYMSVSGSSGLNPAALEVNSSSANGVAIYGYQGSSGSTIVTVNTGTGDLINGFSGPSGGNDVFTVQNDGTVVSKGVVLSSDRAVKENFLAIRPGEVLERVASLPISQWNYKSDAGGIKHLGPVAQDFHAAFGLNGTDDKHISMVDEGGVALAAIQGLNQKVEAGIQKTGDRFLKLEAENAELRNQNESLEKRLSVLEQRLQSLTEIK